MSYVVTERQPSMEEERDQLKGLPAGEPKEQALPPAAVRALAEAEARRKAADEAAPALEKERGGRKEGLEPTRYGDWENKGILSDF